MKTLNLFVCGTIKRRSVQMSIFGVAPPSRRDAVLNYRVANIKIGRRKFPAAEFRRGGKIEGFVLSINKKLLAKADKAGNTKGFTCASGAARRHGCILKNRKANNPPNAWRVSVSLCIILFFIHHINS